MFGVWGVAELAPPDNSHGKGRTRLVLTLGVSGRVGVSDCVQLTKRIRKSGGAFKVGGGGFACFLALGFCPGPPWSFTAIAEPKSTMRRGRFPDFSISFFSF